MAVRNRRSLLFRGDRVGANAIGSGSPWRNGKIHEADTGRWPGSDVYGGPPSFLEKALNVSWLAPVFRRDYECVTGLGCWRQHTCSKDGYLDCSMLCHWIILKYDEIWNSHWILAFFEAWKWDLRKKVWNYLEDNDLADFPRPVHHRIPNFKGSAKAGERLAELPEFINAKVVKVNPDTPQKSVRVAALRSGKILVMQEHIGESGQVSL